MPWSGVTGAIARGKSKSIACVHKSRFVLVWRWICGVKPKPKVVNTPSHRSITPELDKPGVFTTVSLIFQRIERLIFDLPSRPPTPHEVIHIPFAHAQVRHPTPVLDLVRANLPILDEIDPHVSIRFIERDIIDKAKPMHQPCGAVVPLVVGDAPGVFRHLYSTEQKGMITFLTPRI